MNSSPQQARLQQIAGFLDSGPFAGAHMQPLAGDASFRRYVRVLKDGKSAMVMDAPPGREDVRPFVAIADYLHARAIACRRSLPRM